MINTQEYKHRLEDNLQVITAELETIARFEPTTGDWIPLPAQEHIFDTDENSEADGYEVAEERQATLSELETTYRSITLALQKIERGTFGICEISGTPIEPERLDILPTARTCITHRNEERTLPLA